MWEHLVKCEFTAPFLVLWSVMNISETCAINHALKIPPHFTQLHVPRKGTGTEYVLNVCLWSE